MNSKLYLVPNILSDSVIEYVIPEGVIKIIHSLDHFIVENTRSARRFIIKTGYPGKIDDIKFFELNKHTKSEEINQYLDPCRNGINMGVLSEAGVPSVADPGAVIVEIAQNAGIEVVPLTGPSSILLALMASGLNGQSFSFVGYLPVPVNELTLKIKELETRSIRDKQSQIFIETPYRNIRLFKELIKVCKPSTSLCIAVNITGPDEKIYTKNIREWQRTEPDLDKKPAVFIIQAQL